MTFIGAASSWGAAKRGPETAPMALWCSGVAENLQRPQCMVDWHGVIETEKPAPRKDVTLDQAYPQVLSFVSALSREVETVMEMQPLTTPVVVGGDHSVAMGTWSGVVTALEAYKKFGLLWIDAHMDAHTPVTSVQGKWGGHFHGMPLAHLLGHGDKSLCEIASKKQKLNPRYLVLVGVHSFEPGEEELLRRLGVTVFTMEDIERSGLDAVMKQALAIVAKAPKGWGVSLDLDAFDPVDIKCVGTPEAGGLRLQPFLEVFSGLKLPSFPRAVEIVEYVPAKDKTGSGLQAIEKFLWLLFRK